MSAVWNRRGRQDVSNHPPGAARLRAFARSARAGWLEALGVGLSPAAVALVLRLRLMAPSDLPDPAMHTIYIVDPAAVFTRFAQAYAATARLREGARVGFLVPGRLAYLAFGAVPGFFVTRYVLALIAVGPVYLLLRRIYGAPAGVAGVLVVLSSPVIVTALGTDYPDSAVVSYAVGALACLAMPCSPRWRRGWLAAGGALLVLAVWSHGVAVPLVAATLVGYAGVRLVRDRAELIGDVILLVAVAVAVTGLLLLASRPVLGNADDFIGLTWQAYQFLSQPSQIGSWHSSNWQWAPYVAYLLVPPAVLGAFAVAVTRRSRKVPTGVLIIGAAAAGQLALYVWLQFFGHVQTLEEHYFSSTLWAGVCLAFAITVAELARPLSDRPLARWLPAAVLLAVPLGYEADPHVPSLGWQPTGAILAGAVIAAAVAARGGARLRRPLAAATATGMALTAFAGAALVLTVAPIPIHPRLPGTIYDPAPTFAAALGGSAAIDIDKYRIATEMPAFVGPAAYYGEQIFIWWPISVRGPYIEYTGMFHSLYNAVRSDPPVLSAYSRAKLKLRQPAELLLFGISGAPFPDALRNLAALRPTLERTGVLRSGPLVLHVWLIRLGVYYHPPRAAAGRPSSSRRTSADAALPGKLCERLAGADGHHLAQRCGLRCGA
jgi:Dolichyl-phosphate-mannose-protein mannosyltransferase